MNFQLNEARRMKHHFTEIDNNDHQIKFLTYSEISNGHQEYWTNFQYCKCLYTDGGVKLIQNQLPSIGKAAKKREILKNLEKHFLQVQVIFRSF